MALSEGTGAQRDAVFSPRSPRALHGFRKDHQCWLQDWWSPIQRKQGASYLKVAGNFKTDSRTLESSAGSFDLVSWASLWVTGPWNSSSIDFKWGAAESRQGLEGRHRYRGRLPCQVYLVGMGLFFCSWPRKVSWHWKVYAALCDHAIVFSGLLKCAATGRGSIGK